MDREPNRFVDSVARNEALERLATEINAPGPYVMPQCASDEGVREDSNAPEGGHDSEEAE